MAKKNSTKTATKEALQASEPRLQQFSQWKGIDFSHSPHSWSDSPYSASDPSEWPAGDHHNQSDLPANTFMVQNNARIESNGSVETRNETLRIADIRSLKDVSTDEDPGRFHFTGINHMVGGNLFVADDQGEIQYASLESDIIIKGRSNINDWSTALPGSATATDGPDWTNSIAINNDVADTEIRIQTENAIQTITIDFSA